MYKRTFFSIDPFKDAEFLEQMLGLEVEVVEAAHMTPGAGGANASDSALLGVAPWADANASAPTNASVACARRAVLSTLNDVQLHFFESFVTPERRGPRRRVGARVECAA